MHNVVANLASPSCFGSRELASLSLVVQSRRRCWGPGLPGNPRWPRVPGHRQLLFRLVLLCVNRKQARRSSSSTRGIGVGVEAQAPSGCELLVIRGYPEMSAGGKRRLMNAKTTEGLGLAGIAERGRSDDAIVSDASFHPAHRPSLNPLRQAVTAFSQSRRRTVGFRTSL